MEKREINSLFIVFFTMAVALVVVFGYAGITGNNIFDFFLGNTGKAIDTNCTTPVDWKPRDVWVWQSSVVTNSTQRAEFFNFAASHPIRNAYIESERLIKYNQSDLASFISEAKSKCVNVELSFSYEKWALTSYHDYTVDLAQKAAAFSNGVSDKPAGIHFDIEPYILNEWDTDQNSVANQYLDLLEKLNAVTSGKLKLAVTMPFWFDTRYVIRNNINSTLSEEVIDRVDQVAIMDYRDDAGLMIRFVSSEMAYAQNVNKKIVVGAKIDPSGSESETVTFFEEGEGAMEQALNEVGNFYSNNSAFNYFAVHDYKGWKNVSSTSPPPAPTDTTPPTISASNSPATGITNATTVTISATSNEVSTIQIFVDNLSKKSCSAATCSYAQIYSLGNHSYYASATDAAGNKGTSATKSFFVATQIIAPATLSPPSNLAGREVSPGQIDINWTDNSNNENGFVIESSTNPKKYPFSEIARVSVNVNSYSHKGVNAASVSYRVKAYNSDGNSSYSNEIKVRTHDCKWWMRSIGSC